MLVVPVYNVVLAPDATVWFQTEELKKNAGAKGIAVNEKVILIVAKTKEQGEEPAEDSFYPVGAAGTVTEISSQGYAVIRIQYRVDLESVSINPDRTVKLNIHRRNEIDDLDREVEQVKLKNLLQPLRVAVCGNMVSPPLCESIELLKRDDVLARIDATTKLVFEG